MFGIRQFIAASAIVAASVPSIADAKFVNHYAHWHLGQPYGYTDKVVGPNTWNIKGLGFETAPGFIEAMIYHRAAILAKAAGFTHFYEVYATHVCSGSPFISSAGAEGPGACDYVRDEEAHLAVVGTDSPEAEVPCKGHGSSAPNCKTYSVADVIAESDRVLGLTPDQDRQELLDVQRRVVEK